MKTSEILKTSVKNTFRSKMRTFLTVIAIFIGAFTLTLTNGVGAGISGYIDSQLGSIGGSNVISVIKGNPEASSTDTGPAEYDPDKISAGSRFGGEFEAVTEEDIAKIETIAGIETVRPVFSVSPDYIGYGENKYEISVNTTLPGENIDFTAGNNLENMEANEIILSADYVEPLGFTTDEAAIGEKVFFGVTDAANNEQIVEATIVGVQNPSLLDLGINTTQGLQDALYDAQSIGLPDTAPVVFSSAQATYAENTTTEDISALKANLEEAGYFGITVEDQIGVFTTIIDIIVGVLNGFAVIALIAAGFGIINTLLMSVQERTREIGLMKAMGLSAGKIFGLFSMEAVFIGLLGSVIGATAAIASGTILSNVLSKTLGDLGEVQLIVFEPLSVLGIMGIVMGIAFLAGTLPAIRAAKQNPIDALRYE